jgi:hypothetical protein
LKQFNRIGAYEEVKTLCRRSITFDGGAKAVAALPDRLQITQKKVGRDDGVLGRDPFLLPSLIPLARTCERRLRIRQDKQCILKSVLRVDGQRRFPQQAVAQYNGIGR